MRCSNTVYSTTVLYKEAILGHPLLMLPNVRETNLAVHAGGGKPLFVKQGGLSHHNLMLSPQLKQGLPLLVQLPHNHFEVITGSGCHLKIPHLSQAHTVQPLSVASQPTLKLEPVNCDSFEFEHNLFCTCEVGS